MKGSVLNHIENLEISDKLKNLVLPCIIFDLSLDSKSLSGIGGIPLIPDSIFPFYNNEKLRFLANINLQDVVISNNFIPNRGYLLFFIYTGNIGYRYPVKRNEFKVVYINNEIVNFSDNISKHYNLNFYEFVSFPSFQDCVIESNGINSDELLTLMSIQSKIKKEYDINHQIFGHPTAIQGTVRFWWALDYFGYNPEDVDSLPSEEINKLKKEEDNFILLLQLNFSDSRIGIDYFGESVAYFGIHKNDLDTLNFDNAVLVMQNT